MRAGTMQQDLPPAVQMVKVNKWFGQFHVLRDVDLTVAHGERIVVCGPSGSGKSTLIRCMNQLEVHQEGQVLIDGVEIVAGARRLDLVRRNVGMVFQSFNLFPHLTVAENVMLGLTAVLGMKHGEAREQALACLDRVHVADLHRKYPGQISGGQRQRVAIARALAMRPQIMLFDEPTSALDPEMIKEVLDVMIALAQDGITMIAVTHELGFARSVADRVVFMSDGQIIEIAPPDRFFGDPASPRLRAFLDQVLAR
jgi:general L-amino acid transport system ATP-binding protein